MNIVKELLVNIFTKRAPVHPIQLGRWGITTCHKTINNKIDFANEDHCGPCGQYLIKNKNLSTNLNDVKKN